MNYTVYCHTNKINNKKYIGITRQSVQQRWRDGKGYYGQAKFYNAIEKYGWDNFQHEILYENLTEEEACKIESFLIKYYNTIKNGYNTLPGGNVTNHSSATIDKMRKKNIKHSQEVINKITATKIEKYGIHVKCVETNQIFNSMGEASRIMNIDKSSISRCCKGQQLTAGGYHWCFEERIIENIKDKRKKKVRCITSGKIYNSVQEAADDTNSDASNICKVCNGKYKTTNKLKWEWILDD